MPVSPSIVRTRSAAAKIRYAEKAVQANASTTNENFKGVRTVPISTITVEMDPGPASIGMPSGTMPMSSLCAPSLASLAVSLVAGRRACTMSIPIRSRMMPPAILNAGRVMPRISKTKVPAKAKAVSKRKQVQAARLAIRRRCWLVESAVMARKVGTSANGSTRKKMDERVTRKNWTAAEISTGTSF